MNTTEFSSTDWTLLFEDMDRKEEIIYNFFSYVTRLSHSNPQLKKVKDGYGTACHMPDGSWKIINTD